MKTLSVNVEVWWKYNKQTTPLQQYSHSALIPGITNHRIRPAICRAVRIRDINRKWRSQVMRNLNGRALSPEGQWHR